MQYYSSGEIAWQEQCTEQAALGRTSAPVLDAAKLEDRLSRAAALGSQIERTRPDLFAEPDSGFPWLRPGEIKDRSKRPNSSTSSKPAARSRAPGRPAPKANYGWPIQKTSNPSPCKNAGRPRRGPNWTVAWTTPFGKMLKPCR